MTDEEPTGIFRGEVWNASVSAHVCLERLLLGSEGIEQVKSHLPVVAVVVPLQEDVQRDGDSSRILDDAAGDEAAGEETSGNDAWLDDDQPNPDSDNPSRDRYRSTDLGLLESGVEHGLPLRDGLIDQWKDQPVDDLRARPFASAERPAQIGTSLLGPGDARPLSAPGQLDGRAGVPEFSRVSRPSRSRRRG